MLFKAIRLDKITKEVSIDREDKILSWGNSILRNWEEDEKAVKDTETE